MAVPSFANYVFLPWVRQGLTSGIQVPETRGADQPGVVSVAVSLRVNNAEAASRQVRLYGPGDVTGIDPQQIVRTEPRHLATEFEPNYFPLIEFDRPDFPWIFTPARADEHARLRPWVCLVVVRKQGGVSIEINKSRVGLAVLEIKPPARPGLELPDLSESWAWAHSQVSGAARHAASLKLALAGDPALTVSRLLCPRRLDPSTEYLACLVPAFELGCKAGFGLPITADDEKQLQPAWASGDARPQRGFLARLLSLGVSHRHWRRFRGARACARAPKDALRGRQAPGGHQPAWLSDHAAAAPGTLLELEGALCALESSAVPWPPETREPFQSALRGIINAPWQATLEAGHEPLLAPPIYGGWQAAQHTVEIIPAPPRRRPPRRGCTS